MQVESFSCGFILPQKRLSIAGLKSHFIVEIESRGTLSNENGTAVIKGVFVSDRLGLDSKGERYLGNLCISIVGKSSYNLQLI